MSSFDAVREHRGGRAVDLGCGSGFRSLALREHGYEVLAIDASEKLLGRLAGRAGDRGIADFDAVIVTDLVHVRTGGLAIEMELRGRMCTLSAVRRN